MEYHSIYVTRSSRNSGSPTSITGRQKLSVSLRLKHFSSFEIKGEQSRATRVRLEATGGSEGGGVVQELSRED